jgi:hypothetical protein
VDPLLAEASAASVVVIMRVSDPERLTAVRMAALWHSFEDLLKRPPRKA